jgi:UDP-GlcNAc:undecaprenyl-phosphate GlcNAc-1-phosphate transferase
MSPASGDWKLFIETLPIIVFVKLGTFLAAGVYRGIWRYASLADATVFAQAVALSSMATILAVLFGYRFEGFSRTVFAIDGVLLLFLVAGSRFAFRILRRIMPAPHALTGRRVLIFGAGDGGELACRELLNNTDLQYLPVAFVDDDPRKAGKLLHGLRIHSGDRSIAEVCEALHIDEVVLSTTVPPQRLRDLVRACELAGVPVKRIKMELQRIADTELGWVLPSPDAEVPAAAAAMLTSQPSPMLPIERPVHGVPAQALLNDH